MRVVGSLTTLPARYPKLLRTLQSLKNQDYPLDVIYLGIPKVSRRLNQPYPKLPKDILDLCTVIPCDDIGPMTKICAGLLAENDPETVIITFDDDVVYSHNMVSQLMNKEKLSPNAALGSSGTIITMDFPFYVNFSNEKENLINLLSGNLPKTGRKVDILWGFSAIVYKRKFFPQHDQLVDQFFKYPLMDENVYYNDDIMISAYLSKEGIDRMIYGDIPVVNAEKHLYFAPEGIRDSISDDKLKFMKRFRDSVIKVKEWGCFQTTEEVSFFETIGGKVLLLLIFIIILAFLIYVVKKA